MLRTILVVLLTALAAAIFAHLAPPSFAREPARHALLIGNKAYTQKVGPLVNPHNDVDLVAAALRKVGLTVTVLKDATDKQMDTALKRYVAEVRRAGPSALSVFYHSVAAESVRVCREVESVGNLSILPVLEKQHAGRPAADCISARIGELKGAQTAENAPSPRERGEDRVEKQTPGDAARTQHDPATPALTAAPSPHVAAPYPNPLPVNAGRRDDPIADLVPGSGQSARDCPTCPEMVMVPSGSFQMGSPESEEGRIANENPVRTVTIGQPFAVGKFEVTFAEWEACVSGGGCQSNKTPSAMGWGKGRHPVINVSWNDAKEYVEWLSNMTGQTYRMLTEAEWEYVARADTTTPFSTGPTITSKQANFDGSLTYGDSAKGEYRQKTVEVGSLNTPNAFGLHDVHGNVWEWVEDCWINSYNGAASDASARTTACTDGELRVLRGGSWRFGPSLLRSAVRSGNSSTIRIFIIGFRLARSVSR